MRTNSTTMSRGVPKKSLHRCQAGVLSSMEAMDPDGISATPARSFPFPLHAAQTGRAIPEAEGVRRGSAVRPSSAPSGREPYILPAAATQRNAAVKKETPQVHLLYFYWGTTSDSYGPPDLSEVDNCHADAYGGKDQSAGATWISA